MCNLDNLTIFVKEMDCTPKFCGQVSLQADRSSRTKY